MLIFPEINPPDFDFAAKVDMLCRNLLLVKIAHDGAALQTFVVLVSFVSNYPALNHRCSLTDFFLHFHRLCNNLGIAMLINLHERTFSLMKYIYTIA